MDPDLFRSVSVLGYGNSLVGGEGGEGGGGGGGGVCNLEVYC